MKRRHTILAAAAALCAWPLRAFTQPAGRVFRLGILRSGPTPSGANPAVLAVFEGPLRELGYVEGRNLLVEGRYAQNDLQRLPALARELVELKVDVILPVATSAIQAAKGATTTIPIVFLNNGDPVAAGLVPSLARTDSNLTAVLIAPEGSLAAKRVDMLKQCVVGASRVALLVPEVKNNVFWQAQIDETRQATAALGLQLDVVEVLGGDYAAALAALAALRSQALVVAPNPTFLRDRKPIIELAAKYRLAAIYEWPSQLRDGGLMSYGANQEETYRQVVLYIDRVFKGAKPGDLPIWQPIRLHLVINQPGHGASHRVEDSAGAAVAGGRGDRVNSRRALLMATAAAAPAPGSDARGRHAPRRRARTERACEGAGHLEALLRPDAQTRLGRGAEHRPRPS
ncbi:MAG: ABC transporter substrate-binding protein [Rubrivivax sp.]